MNTLWSQFVAELEPYVPGEQPQLDDLVKLNTNENPFPPSPAVIQAITQTANDNLRLYPDPESSALRSVIAKYYDLPVESTFVGNGSDEVLAHAFNAFFRQDKPVLFPDITYSFYPVYCQLYGITFNLQPLNNEYEIDFTDYCQPNGGIIFPNPNAPTGIAKDLASIRQLLEKNTESVVIVDEAYVDFGAQSAVSLIADYKNLLVVKTLSKARSLAGIRLGYALGSPELIEALNRVKNSFNSYPIDSLAQSAAIASFSDEAYFKGCQQKLIGLRDELVEGLHARGFNCLPSAANFVFARHDSLEASAIASRLRAHSVIVRHFSKQKIAAFIRVTVGTRAQHQRLFDALDAII